MEHDMNINDVPAMMLCSNCLRRATGDQWNDDEVAGISRRLKVASRMLDLLEFWLKQ